MLNCDNFQEKIQNLIILKDSTKFLKLNCFNSLFRFKITLRYLLQLFSQFTNVEKLDLNLGSISLQDEGAQVLFENIINYKELTHFSLNLRQFF